MPMTRRTAVTLAAGFAIFVGGSSGAAYLGSRDTGSAASAAGGGKVPVLFAAGPVDAGTPAATALSEGRIRSKTVAPGARPGNAVTDASQLTGRVSAAAIAPGSLVTSDMFAVPQTRIGSVVIPPGKRALSLEMSPVAGVSGFVGAGDRIDVYGVANGEKTPPSVRLVLQGVEVLNVNGAGLPTAQGQPGGPNLVYLLAVSPAEAERLIYLNEYEKLFFDLVPKGEGPVATPGAGPAGAFQAV
jgi:Flp pilus assembly protein CpaB